MTAQTWNRPVLLLPLPDFLFSILIFSLDLLNSPRFLVGFRII